MRNSEERSMHLALAEVITYRAVAGLVWWHTPNEGARRVRQNTRTGQWFCPEGSILKRLGMRAGVSDLVFILPPTGRVAVLELKAPRKRPTKEQIAFLDDVRRAGGLAEWTDDLNTAVGILERWGALKARFYQR